LPAESEGIIITIEARMQSSDFMVKTSILIIAVFAFLVLAFPIQTVAAATIQWDVAGHFLSDGSIGGAPNVITVTDASANLDPNKRDTIQITVTSTSDPTGIVLTLTETGKNTAIFQNTNILFSDSGTTIPIGRTITIMDHDAVANTNSTAIDNLHVILVSSNDTVGINPVFSETAADTGIFTAKDTFGTGPTSNSTSFLHVAPGDEITIVDTVDGLFTNTIITPNSDPGFGLIFARIFDTVSAHYNGLIDNTTINDDTGCGCGGGGGGPVFTAHPGFVLDLLAAIGGSPYVVSPPSFGGGYYHYSDGLTITQGDSKTTFDTSLYNQEIPKQVMTAGEKVNMTFKTFESYNPTGVVHMGLYFIPRGQDMTTDNSIGSIVWEKDKPLEINDPNHILSGATAPSNSDGKFQYTQFSFVPEKSYDKMSFLVRAWNDHLYSTDIRVHDEIYTPPASKTLPAGVIQYDNFDDLQAALEKDQFYKPQLMSHIHSTADVFMTSDGGRVYWLYDTINHTVTLVIADKNDKEISSQQASLQQYEIEKKGDYKFMHFTVQQLNRWNEQQMQNAMGMEAAKATFSALEKGLVSWRNW